MTAWRTLGTAGQVALDERNSRAGVLRGAAAVADAITADVMGRAVQADDVVGLVDDDLGRRGGENQSLPQDAAKLGDDIGNHGATSSW